MKLGVEVEDEANQINSKKRRGDVWGGGSLKLTGPVLKTRFNLSHTHNFQRHEQQPLSFF